MAAFWEAFKGAQVELQACSNTRERITTAYRISRIIVSELGGALSLIPYGWRAWRLYDSLQPLEAKAFGAARHGVLLARDIRYGPRERNLLDLYIPATGDAHPVALFCHGGVWATGERWHYAPLAVRLAQAGVMTAVASYSLYPRAGVRDMVRELGAALSWTLNNARSYGGDAGQVSALGHSAGAQLLAMVLLHRARAARGTPAQEASCAGAAGGSSDASPAAQNGSCPGAEGTSPDTRMPARFVGMAGVYDIAQHYQYEAGRGVQHLSTMERACGGPSNFTALSPAAVLARATPQQPAGKQAAGERRLRGEAIAARMGISRSGAGGIAVGPSIVCASVAVQASSAALQQADGRADSRSGSSSSGTSRSLEQNPASSAACDTMLDFRLEDARRLPPFYLMHGLPDATVPWHESAEMCWRLHDCGVPAKLLMYSKDSHADFAIDWRPLRRPSSSAGDGALLRDSAADLVAILRGEAHEVAAGDLAVK